MTTRAASRRSVRRLLEPDETLSYAASSHPVLLARPLGGSVLVLAGVVAVFVTWRSAPLWFGLLLAAVLIADALLLAARFLACRSSLLLVTSLRIVHHHGVLRRHGWEIPASRIDQAVYVQSLPGRLLGYGTLSIALTSAPASAGTAPEPAGLRHVRAPARAQREIHRSAEAAHLAQASRPPATSAWEAPPDYLALLDRLYQRGIVSEAELEEKRAELLEGT